jgi:hypothetical protein
VAEKPAPGTDDGHGAEEDNTPPAGHPHLR